VANPAEVQYPWDEGVVLNHQVPRADDLESLSSRTFPGGLTSTTNSGLSVG